jgi:hypothetical protein
MAWDTTDLTNYNDIIIQDGVFAYNFTASGAIYKGQAVAVCPNKDMYVLVTDSDAGTCDCIGLAAQNASDGDQIPIAGPGNICWACCDNGADVVAGAPLYGDTNGILDASAPQTTEKIACYELNTSTAGTTNYIVKVLLV